MVLLLQFCSAFPICEPIALICESNNPTPPQVLKTPSCHPRLGRKCFLKVYCSHPTDLQLWVYVLPVLKTNSPPFNQVTGANWASLVPLSSISFWEAEDSPFSGPAAEWWESWSVCSSSDPWIKHRIRASGKPKPMGADCRMGVISKLSP